MADTAPKVAEAEREDPAHILDEKVDAFVKLIRKSKHLIVCTGAGVSTSAGIADFRGPNGVWTLRAQGKQAHNKKNTLQAIPTPTHMAIVELQNRGILTHVISQNCDGLHRRSGVLPDRISELHGNSNREYCRDCGKEYLRDFRAVSTYETSIHDHRTGRRCALCNGALLDTIINFGENLPEEPLRLAREHADKADLCLVLGSSLTVSPSNEIPETVGRRRGAKLVICNLQSTPIDCLSDIRVFAKADDLMTRMMAKLELPISPFILRRRLVIRMETLKGGRQQLLVRGVDVDGTPATFLQSVKLVNNRRIVLAEPFVINFRSDPEPGTIMKLELEFMGHYNEPNLEVEYTFEAVDGPARHYLLQYDPSNGNWTVTQSEGEHLEDGAQDAPLGMEKEVIDLTLED
ncbi:NAD-dependent deacetylase sirtuin-7 [Astrocystis sublimbata]|nr:NAD-dependent deacetylase sirtuin-7 [Astrocystis sublimbata]